MLLKKINLYLMHIFQVKKSDRYKKLENPFQP